MGQRTPTGKRPKKKAKTPTPVFSGKSSGFKPSKAPELSIFMNGKFKGKFTGPGGKIFRRAGFKKTPIFTGKTNKKSFKKSNLKARKKK